MGLQGLGFRVLGFWGLGSGFWGCRGYRGLGVWGYGVLGFGVVGWQVWGFRIGFRIYPPTQSGFCAFFMRSYKVLSAAHGRLVISSGNCSFSVSFK